MEVRGARTGAAKFSLPTSLMTIDGGSMGRTPREDRDGMEQCPQLTTDNLQCEQEMNLYVLSG